MFPIEAIVTQNEKPWITEKPGFCVFGGWKKDN